MVFPRQPNQPSLLQLGVGSGRIPQPSFMPSMPAPAPASKPLPVGPPQQQGGVLPFLLNMAQRGAGVLGDAGRHILTGGGRTGDPQIDALLAKAMMERAQRGVDTAEHIVPGMLHGILGQLGQRRLINAMQAQKANTAEVRRQTLEAAKRLREGKPIGNDLPLYIPEEAYTLAQSGVALRNALMEPDRLAAEADAKADAARQKQENWERTHQLNLDKFEAEQRLIPQVATSGLENINGAIVWVERDAQGNIVNPPKTVVRAPRAGTARTPTVKGKYYVATEGPLAGKVVRDVTTAGGTHREFAPQHIQPGAPSVIDETGRASEQAAEMVRSEGVSVAEAIERFPGSSSSAIRKILNEQEKKERAPADGDYGTLGQKAYNKNIEEKNENADLIREAQWISQAIESHPYIFQYINQFHLWDARSAQQVPSTVERSRASEQG